MWNLLNEYSARCRHGLSDVCLCTAAVCTSTAFTW